MVSRVPEQACGRARRAGACLFAATLTGLLLFGWMVTATARASHELNDSSDGFTMWVSCEKDVLPLTDSELDAWRSRGVDGFVCMAERLRGLGGSQDFTADAQADLNADGYRLQRALRDSRVVERAAARGIKMYLGVKLANYYNEATPLAEWFDDRAWSEQVLPKMADLSAAAKQLSFAGIAFDQELYPQRNGVQTATWGSNYPGRSHTEAQVRDKARERGAMVMDAILAGFPGAELAVYHAFFPGDWRELIQERVNGLTDTSTERLDVDFWDGMTSVEGYGAIRFFDSVFYKDSHRGTWESALTHNQNRVYATFSRRFANWDYAWSRVHVSPFAWIDDGPNAGSSFDDARSPDYVAEQLLAFRKWGAGGEFANFVYAPLDQFNYSPYVSAMQDASAPAPVDGQDPTLQVNGAKGERATELIEGTAHDNLAIRAVHWQDDRGGSGVATLDWRPSGDEAGNQWQTRWSIPAGALTPGTTKVTIRAEDIKGHGSAAATVASNRSLKLTANPPKRLTVKRRRARIAFSFTSDAGTQDFACRLDRGPWRDCSSGKVAYRSRAQRRWLRHTFEVRDSLAYGDGGSTPTRYRFKIKRR